MATSVDVVWGMKGGRMAVVLFACFNVVTVGIVAPSAGRLFFGRFGRRHRLAGLLHGMLLLVSFGLTSVQVCGGRFFKSWLVLDVVLGVSGVCVTLTAAFDFRSAHAKAKNAASGTLDETAVVTYSEMIEHSFYQGLNLAQVVYLHAVRTSGTQLAALLACATAPWLVRDRFPVNKFSDNYRANAGSKSPLIRALYRIKKYQYILYKHGLLHGLNLAAALDPSHKNLATSDQFRLYWFGLNTSYVMEFFLQTLVRRKYMRQRTLLALQLVLMAASTLAALPILFFAVDLRIAAVSLALNFIRRHHDFSNTMLIAALATLLRDRMSLLPSSSSTA